jgi:hypothetical protein
MAHHYQFRISEYQVTFTNEETGEEITMTIPSQGAYDDPQRVITPEEVEALSELINEVLEDYLQSENPD